MGNQLFRKEFNSKSDPKFGLKLRTLNGPAQQTLLQPVWVVDAREGSRGFSGVPGLGVPFSGGDPA